MTQDTIHIYSDASFSNQHKIAVAGFAVFESDDFHQEANHSFSVQTRVFKEKTNIAAELAGIMWALTKTIEKLGQTNPGDHLKDRRITLYTDCQSIARLPYRRQRLESSNFISKRSGRTLSNATLYKQFFVLYDKVTLDLVWVKGHTSKKDRNLIEQNFSRVDKTMRKTLREFVESTSSPLTTDLPIRDSKPPV